MRKVRVSKKLISAAVREVLREQLQNMEATGPHMRKFKFDVEGPAELDQFDNFSYDDEASRGVSGRAWTEEITPVDIGDEHFYFVEEGDDMEDAYTGRTLLPNSRMVAKISVTDAAAEEGKAYVEGTFFVDPEFVQFLQTRQGKSYREETVLNGILGDMVEEMWPDYNDYNIRDRIFKND